ncbi:thioredoxin family protein [candidate division WWE3 bacterium]|uniref:Thioredoxin family protein n=1 Tax=candidate division WWE3 bacterium TaxID=2053526 RepID=A0A7X9E670_UNCKA|nr:thioredoxin family protein [candidate division WWE3 bacterium]
MKILVNKMKLIKCISILLLVFTIMLGAGRSHAAEKVNLYFFWGQGCPHCAKEKVFLQNLVQKDSSLVLHDFEVYNNTENRDKLIEAAQKLNTEVNGVPFLVIGDKYLVGYLSDQTTGVEIQKLIEDNKTNGCFDIFEPQSPKETVVPDVPIQPQESASTAINSERPENSDKHEDDKEEECVQDKIPGKPVLPKFGSFDLESLSLPALTVVLGFLDGFNPCAMWVLLFLISLLLGMKGRKRMWVLGIAFIISSASVYLLFMVAWLNLFLFVGFIFWVRAFIAVISLFGGFMSLKKFLSKDTSGCDVVGEEKRRNVFDKLGKITADKSFLMALIGIMALAFAVNLVELVCSAGLPAVYTQVLALNDLSILKYYSYIFLYITFFMLDDLFVFFVAMITLQMTGVTTKYVKWSRLIGGLLMIIIGILLLFKPEILMFS